MGTLACIPPRTWCPRIGFFLKPKSLKFEGQLEYEDFKAKDLMFVQIQNIKA
jgi:hypothetical protein